MLLQVLDDGRLTDGQGRTVDFKNTILIMTSNLGSQFLVNPDMDADAKKKAVMDAVHMQFKPEFINRLDELVMFHPLTREELGGIVDIQVAQVSARLTDRRITLDVTDSAREWLANTGYDPAYGARPLRRLVQTEVGDQLARMLLAGEVHDGDTVLVDQTGGDHLELSAWAADQLEDMGEVKTDDSADVPNPAERRLSIGYLSVVSLQYQACDRQHGRTEQYGDRQLRLHAERQPQRARPHRDHHRHRRGDLQHACADRMTYHSAEEQFFRAFFLRWLRGFRLRSRRFC